MGAAEALFYCFVQSLRLYTTKQEGISPPHSCKLFAALHVLLLHLRQLLLSGLTIKTIRVHYRFTASKSLILIAFSPGLDSRLAMKGVIELKMTNIKIYTLRVLYIYSTDTPCSVYTFSKVLVKHRKTQPNLFTPPLFST